MGEVLADEVAERRGVDSGVVDALFSGCDGCRESPLTLASPSPPFACSLTSDLGGEDLMNFSSEEEAMNVRVPSFNEGAPHVKSWLVVQFLLDVSESHPSRSGLDYGDRA